MMTSAVTSAISRKLQCKPAVADSYSYLESAVARFQQVHYLKITSRSVVELEKKPAATIQQRRKFSSWRFSDTDSRLATQTSSSPQKFRFLNAKQDSLYRKLHREIQRELSRVQARFHAVTAKLRSSATRLHAIFESLRFCWHRPKHPDFTLFTPDFSQGPSISALLENQTSGFAHFTQIQTSNNKNEEQVEEEEQDQFWGWVLGGSWWSIGDDKSARSWLDRDLMCGITVSHAVGGLPDSGASFVRCGARLGPWLVPMGPAGPGGGPAGGDLARVSGARRSTRVCDGCVEVNIAWE
ncbi:hypothetical protein F511_31144 [Dorcoceras hygrometricum]|uniref:Uncharacterized protein n=1 Tax=Dorcoceras hygrometricum TaxID=472368 RepID=A0A2Z7BT27_9LAMI|nr:hypothetical protein F511_31144 [Dorcoceras hygrometricum]